MSRIGKMPITVPAGVTVTIEDNHVTVKGPKGELARQINKNMKLTMDNGVITVERPDDEKESRSLHGLSRPVVKEPPAGITFEVPAPNKIVVSGADKEVVGAVAADIRTLRPPEPYKGKGIRYEGEHVRRKIGKAGAKGKK